VKRKKWFSYLFPVISRSSAIARDRNRDIICIVVVVKKPVLLKEIAVHSSVEINYKE
jgi:hypothetical protein